jgi:tRNA threonylcarbamoyladenosine biosynthesis protein TsaE
MGYEEYFFSDAYCFIEWPEKIPNLIEDDMIVVKMHLDENKRVINVLI